MSAAQPLHGTSLARHGPYGWRGLMLRGPSGIGKSDLALRLMAQGWSLISDDWTRVWANSGHLYASAPPAIAGRMEIRGVGLVSPGPICHLARLELVVSLSREPVERLPEPDFWQHRGVSIRHLVLDPRPASASLAVAAAFAAL